LTKEQIGMSKKRTKQYLMLLMVIGLVSIAAGGSGTFASFSAETVNSGNYFASGTLFLHNTHGTTTCTSESSSDNLTPTGCDTLFTLPIITAGSTYTAHLVLQNAGTIDADGIKLYEPGGCTSGNGTIVHALLNGAVVSGASNGGTLTVHPLAGAIANGDTIVVSSADGNNRQSFTASGATTAGSTTINVNTTNWNFSYGDGSDVTDTTASGATPAFATSSLCTGLKIAVEETDPLNSNATERCAFGTTAGASSCTLASSGALGSVPSTLLTAATLDLTPDSGTNTGTNLSAGQSREFDIKVLAPASLDNTYQDRKASFALAWHIDQAP
jgi:predicted ribosomally synthesized peptide with SipW-like signal peptide